nr:hypothetical protein [Tanacetum cinerariifolium]
MLDSKAYKEYYAVASRAEPTKAKTKYKKKADEPVTSFKSKTAPASKGSRLKSLAKVAKTAKKKQPAMMPKTKGLTVLSESKFPDEQQQKVTGTNEGTGVRLEDPDVPKYALESDDESWTFSQNEDDADEDVNDDSKETKSDSDGDDLTYPNLSTYKADDEKEEEEKADDDEESSDHRVYTPPDHQLIDKEENQEGDDEVKEGEEEQQQEKELYRDLNINLQRSNVVQANQFTKDTHVILTTVPLVLQHQSSSVSSDLVSKFINPYLDTSIDSILSPNIQSETLVNVSVSIAAETPFSDTTIPQPPIPNIQPLQQTPESTTTTIIPTTTLLDIPNFASLFYIVDNYLASKMKDVVDVAVQLQTNKLREEAQAENQEILNQKNLYNALVELYNSDKDIFSSYSDVVTLKRGRYDHDKDEEPSARSNGGSKRRRSGKEAKASKELTYKESKSSSFKRKALDVDKSQWNPSSSPTPDRMCKSVVELEYHLEKVFKAINDCLDWHNTEGKPYPHDLSKPLPLIQKEHGCQFIPWDYFINKDLEYLKGGSSSKKYTTSITKTKAIDYDQVKWIEDKLYKFREGNFKRLRRQDIEEMLLLLIQSKLSNLNLEERYALNVALRMFTQRIVILERVEDLQLGVESYQNKINLTRPDTYRSDLKRMPPHTAYPDIQGIIYEDEMNKNRLMHTDELYKFSDGTLNHVRTAFNDAATRTEMDYLTKRKWSN